MSRDITLCHPELQKKAAQLVEKCRQQGLIIKITDCLRDAAEQEDCVRRGTSSLSYPNSHHNWGTAFDFCRNDGKGAYNDTDGFFKKVGKIGQSIGLEWGGAWTSPVDKPHFQLPDWGTGTTLLKLTYGSPAAFKKVWVKYEEEEEVTQEQFNKMMDNYLAERNKKPVSDWAKSDMENAKTEGITDGTMPQAFATREQVISLIMRAKQ